MLHPDIEIPLLTRSFLSGPNRPQCQEASVYLVHADAKVRRRIFELLSGLKMTVIVFGPGTELLDIYGTERAGCVLLGLDLPDISGFDLPYGLAQKENPPVIFISVHSDITSTVREMKASATDFDLRDETIPGHEVSQLLLACDDEFAHDKSISFALAVVGTVQPLKPVVRDEAYGRELLTNAFQHSDAGKIGSEITYDRVVVWLRVRDNGRGMVRTVLDDERAGHCGLTGTRECAYHIGNRLNISSKPGSGTEVELIIPSKIAYQMPPEKSRLRWIKPARSKGGQRV